MPKRQTVPGRQTVQRRPTVVTKRTLLLRNNRAMRKIMPIRLLPHPLTVAAFRPQPGKRHPIREKAHRINLKRKQAKRATLRISHRGIKKLWQKASFRSWLHMRTSTYSSSAILSGQGSEPAMKRTDGIICFGRICRENTKLLLTYRTNALAVVRATEHMYI